jgi:hypothetical protein
LDFNPRQIKVSLSWKLFITLEHKWQFYFIFLISKEPEKGSIPFEHHLGQK